MKLNNKTILALLTPLLSLAFATSTAVASDFHSPRTDALGGAGHASPLLGDAIYLNPSFTSFIQTHSLSLNYLVYGAGQTNSPYGVIDYYGHNINVSVLDGSPD